VRLLHRRDHPQPLQRPKGERNQRLADVVARELLALDHEHLVAVFRENGRRAGAGRAAADDDDVVVFIVSDYCLQMSYHQNTVSASPPCLPVIIGQNKNFPFQAVFDTTQP
jgi:hypothetical protein